MRKSRFTEEQIISILKETEAGANISELCRKHGVSKESYYRWKAKYGGMEVSEARRLRALEEDLLEQGVPAQAALVIDERPVEGGVVGDHRRIADEAHQLVHHLVEFRGSANLLVGDAVHPDGVRRDQPFGMHQGVKGPPGRQQILDLDAADLDQPIAGLRIEAGGFGVEDDFAGHGPY